MKKFLLGAVTVVALAGCTVESSDSSDTQRRDDAIYTPATVPPRSNAEIIDDTYLAVIYGSYPFVSAMGDRTVIDLGKDLCDEVDRGMTVPQLAMLSIQYGVDAEMLGFITGAAISAYCPWNSGFFDGY